MRDGRALDLALLARLLAPRLERGEDFLKNHTHTHGAGSAEHAAADCAHAASHAQFREDVALVPTLLAAAMSDGASSSGRFVELGAFDGYRLSNTWMLEHCFNWTGLLIEANPVNFAALRRSRRNAVKVHSAVCAKESTVEMAGSNVISGQTDLLTEEQVHLYYQGRRPRKNESFVVPCRPLEAIMSAAGYPAANFLSLDVEGAEAMVLSSVDPAVFRVIMVETQAHSANELKRIDNLILREGSRMRRARTLWVPKSTLYVRDDVLEVPVGHSLVRSMRGKWSVTYPAPAAGR